MNKRKKEEEDGGTGGEGGSRSDQVGVTMAWPSQEDAHTSDGRILQAVALADSPSYDNIP